MPYHPKTNYKFNHPILKVFSFINPEYFYLKATVVLPASKIGYAKSFISTLAFSFWPHIYWSNATATIHQFHISNIF